MKAKEFLHSNWICDPPIEKYKEATIEIMELYTKAQKEDMKNLLFLAKEICGIHHPFLQTDLYKRLVWETK